MNTNRYVIYLRKSRSDLEAEQHGEGETLARHEQTLLDLSHKMHLNITDIYREIVSGESIAARPVMQRLISEVEQGAWTGVLVMEVERLARGDTIDQGIIAQTFKFSNTKIITPLKIYDPSNEFDEEYFEFGLFMSRREYKTINRRLQRGRVASVKEGKFVGSRPPYGYIRKKLEKEKGWTLEPHPQEADIVRLIFEWYAVGVSQENGAVLPIGPSLIARRLNEMGIPSQRGKQWSPSSVREILENPVYIGFVTWNGRNCVKKVVDGHIVCQRPRAPIEDRITVKGLHPPIVSKEIFERTQDIYSQHKAPPIQNRNILKNPLSGVVVCGKCGRSMVRRPYNTTGMPDALTCQMNYCDNVSSYLELVEKRILDSLEEWLKEYRIKLGTGSKASEQETKMAIQSQAMQNIEKKMSQLRQQEDNIHNLLEQGIYTVETFLERSRYIAEQQESLLQSKKALEKEIALESFRQRSRLEIIPKVEHLLAVYESLPDARAKNDMLKEVLEKVVYIKDKERRGDLEGFEITLYPRLPRGEELY